MKRVIEMVGVVRRRVRERVGSRAVRFTLGAVAGLVIAFAFIPVPDPLFDSPVSPVLEGADGSLLGARIAEDGQWRFPAVDSVPTKFATAITTFEDRRYYRHPGVDPAALARAVWLNAREGEVVSGASTLTMQVARMARGNRSRTYRQKAIEALWSLRIEIGRSKEEVLSLYAANAPFGGNVVGLEAAAWRYFGRGPADLSWAESAMLAVLPNSPGLIHPGRNRDRLREKRDELLRALHESDALDDTELELALLEPLPEEPVPLPRLAPHLLESLAARDEDEVGRRYRSVIDPGLQRTTNRIVAGQAEGLRDIGVRNAAVLVIDNETFEVLAYVGNSDWSTEQGSGAAIDLVHRPRSTGSILKPLLYASMLDAGELLPTTLVPDVPSQFAGYMPENYDRTFRGAVPASAALARSLNIPAVWMLSQHGVDRFYDFLTNMGMSTLHRQPQEYGLTLILGGSEGTLWELTTMYANVARAAQHGRARDRTERLMPRLTAVAADTSTGRPLPISTGAAWLTLDALKEVVRPGVDAQWRSFENTQEVAWKTGTSWGHRDAWAIGSSARYTIGVWVGNATGEGRPELTGVAAAAPILFEVFDAVERVDWRPRPDYALERRTVCAADGYLPVAGCETEVVMAPRDSHFDRSSPNHRFIHLAADGLTRVDARCESVSRMRHESRFVLPPGQEYFYRRAHSGYRGLPPVRADCAALETAPDFDFLYPERGSRVYVPVELDGSRGRVVFAVAHRRHDATLYWHIDDRFHGSTTTFHEQALDLPPGRHTVTVVDEEGARASRTFTVLSKDAEVVPGR